MLGQLEESSPHLFLAVAPRRSNVHSCGIERVRLSFRAVPLLHVNFDLLGLCRFHLRQHYFQNAVLVGGFHF
jgi:hypothetical protein